MAGWQHAVYPVALLVSIGCLSLIDRQYRFAFWRNYRRAAVTMIVSVVFFICWDICGIRLDLFYSADSTYRSGILLGPSFPIEELLFLVLLNYTVLLGWAYGVRRR